ncbi:hypothetical protein DXG01_002979 [Tephrocybe rancida]|nr:hypothetical protein DXG01_002979 [Tephrocybe rancida]
MDQFADPLPVLIAAWPRLWKWMEFLYQSAELVESTLGSVSANTLTLAIGGVFVHIIHHPPTTSTVAATAGTLRLAVNMFIQLGVRPPTDPVEITTRQRNAAVSLMDVLVSPESDFGELVAALGPNKRHAARALFRPIAVATRVGGPWARYTSLLIAVHFNIVSRNPAYYASLPTKIIIRNICGALAYFVTTYLPPSTVSGYNANHDCTTYLVSLLARYATDAAIGHAWLIYAIRHNAVGLLLKSARYIGVPGIEPPNGPPIIARTVRSLLDIFRLYVLHRPVMQRFSGDPVIRSKFSTRDADVQWSWDSLSLAVGSQEALHVEFDSHGSILRCSYTECDAEWEHVTQRCAACKVAFYCSSTCQKIDWPDHKERCRTFDPNRRYMESPRTIAFFHFVMKQALMADKREARKRRDELLNNPSTPPPYIFLADCSDHYPPKIKIDTVTNLKLDVSEHDMERIPLLLPVGLVVYGAGAPKTVVSAMQVSGNLFGWLDEHVEENT